MGWCGCPQCGRFEELYRLKLNLYLLSAKSAGGDEGSALPEIERLRSGTMVALRALLSHWKECEQHRRASHRKAAQLRHGVMAAPRPSAYFYCSIA